MTDFLEEPLPDIVPATAKLNGAGHDGHFSIEPAHLARALGASVDDVLMPAHIDGRPGATALWGSSAALLCIVTEEIDNAAAIAHAVRANVEAASIAVVAAARIERFDPGLAPRGIVLARSVSRNSWEPSAIAAFTARHGEHRAIGQTAPTDWIHVLRERGADAVRQALEDVAEDPAPQADKVMYEPPGMPISEARSLMGRLKTATAFAAEYRPLAYSIEPIVRSNSIYTCTARTGAGKTAWLVIVGLAVASGRGEIIGCDVEPGRVAYLAFENPDDVRMRMMVAAYLLNIDLREIGDRFVILDARMKPEEVLVLLRGAGAFAMIIADTLAAWFDGADINDNVQGGEFVRRCRPLTGLSGNPSVLIAAHPVKNASADQIVPYGGGAILNEVDGNLTLWKKPDTGLVELHWQGKLRGLEFKPMTYRFEIVGSPDVVDVKGRQVQLPVLRPCDEADEEAQQDAEINLDAALLRAMLAAPTGSQAQWATAIGIKHKSGVNKRLHRLKSDKLVDTLLGKWIVTPKGEKALDPHEK